MRVATVQRQLLLGVQPYLNRCGIYCIFSYRGLEFVSATRSLIIRTVQPFHTGLYRCEGLGIVERCRYFSDNASITVRGMYN